MPILPTNSPSNLPSMSGHKSSHTVPIAVSVSVVGVAIILGSIVLFLIARRRRQHVSSVKSTETEGDLSPRPFFASNSRHSYNTETYRMDSASAAALPTSKAQMAQVAQPLSPSSIAATAGPSVSDRDSTPTERETATYLWNLLLRHPRRLSGHPAGPSNSEREEDQLVHPPAYDDM